MWLNFLSEMVCLCWHAKIHWLYLYFWFSLFKYVMFVLWWPFCYLLVTKKCGCKGLTLQKKQKMNRVEIIMRFVRKKFNKTEAGYACCFSSTTIYNRSYRRIPPTKLSCCTPMLAMFAAWLPTQYMCELCVFHYLHKSTWRVWVGFIDFWPLQQLGITH